MYLRVLRDVLRGIYPMFRWLSNTCIAEMYSVVFDTYRKRILEYHGIRLNTEAQRGAYSGDQGGLLSKVGVCYHAYIPGIFTYI